MYLQTGENTKWAETFVWCLLLIFKDVYQDHLTQLLPFTWDFVAKGQHAGLGPSGLTEQKHHLKQEYITHTK